MFNHTSNNLQSIHISSAGQTKSVKMQECVMCNFESKSSIRALAIYQASYSQLKLEGRLQNENEMKH